MEPRGYWRTFGASKGGWPVSGDGPSPEAAIASAKKRLDERHNYEDASWGDKLREIYDKPRMYDGDLQDAVKILIELVLIDEGWR